MERSTQQFLESLSEYPAAYQLDEASNYAQTKATEYALSVDTDAVITVEECEVYVKSKIMTEEQIQNVQVIFDEAFGDKIFDMGFRE